MCVPSVDVLSSDPPECTYIHIGSNVDGGKPLSEEAQKLLEKAIGFHTEHLQVADEGGQFVAHINLGICASQLRDYSTANYHHEEAMKVALDLQVDIFTYVEKMWEGCNADIHPFFLCLPLALLLTLLFIYRVLMLNQSL